MCAARLVFLAGASVITGSFGKARVPREDAEGSPDPPTLCLLFLLGERRCPPCHPAHRGSAAPGAGVGALRAGERGEGGGVRQHDRRGGALPTSSPRPSSLVATGRLKEALGHGGTATVRRRRHFPPLFFPRLPWHLPDNQLQRGKRAARDEGSRHAWKGTLSPPQGSVGVRLRVRTRACVCTLIPHSLQDTHNFNFRVLPGAFQSSPSRG